MPTIESLLKDAYANWDDAEVLSRAGQELQRRSRLAEARQVLERAVDLEPTDLDAWANLAFACYRNLDDQDGHAVLRRGIAATESDLLRATLSTFCEKEEAGQIREALKETDDPAARAILLGQRFWQGEHEDALEGMRALEAEHPDDATIRSQLLWTLLGARARGILEGLDLHEDGLPLVDAVVAETPDSLEGWWMKMQMLHAEKDWDGLVEATAEALKHLPDEETVMLFRARAFREKGDEDRAIQFFLRAIGAKPSFAGARVELGKLYEKQGRLEFAEEVFREIGAANPDYAMGPMSLALFLGRRGRWEEAETVFLETWPKIPPMFRAGFQQNAQAKELFEREAVREVVGAGEGDEGEGA